MLGPYKGIDVERIIFDPKNPRISLALKKYGDKTTEERVAFALQSSGGGGGYKSLEESILQCGYIIDPIKVIPHETKENTFVCIDGNTRLSVYKRLAKTNDNWKLIPSIVCDNAAPETIEEIRLAAHMVGAREWPAYEKASYLHGLKYSDLLSMKEIIGRCGGNAKDIEDSISAYDDMNVHYRDRIDSDQDFIIDRYSGFVELQKKGIKQAIYEAGFTLDDFGDWIKDVNIKKLNDVRQLPSVLQDEEAKAIFLQGGVDSFDRAKKDLEQRTYATRDEGKIQLKEASLLQLSKRLRIKIEDISHQQVRSLKNPQNEEEANASKELQDLLDDLTELVSEINDA